MEYMHTYVYTPYVWWYVNGTLLLFEFVAGDRRIFWLKAHGSGAYDSGRWELLDTVTWKARPCSPSDSD